MEAPRISYAKYPDAIRPLIDLGKYLRKSSIEDSLLELVFMRASQLNGCAYCLDMHSKDARAGGETEQRLYLLQAWREAPMLFNERERAALAWTEAVTHLENGEVPQEIFEQVREQFSEQELVDLNMAVVVINGWNRLAIPFKSVPGTYQPPKR